MRRLSDSEVFGVALALGSVSALLLAATAGPGFYVDVVYDQVDASDAYNDLDGLRREIEQGLFARNLRRRTSAVAAVVVATWLAFLVGVRHRAAWAAALALGLLVAAIGGDRATSLDVVLIEAAAVAVTLVGIVVLVRGETSARRSVEGSGIRSTGSKGA